MGATVEPNFEGNFTFARKRPFRLDGGGKLNPVTLRYAVYGEPDERRSNVVLVCHALSGSARAAEWWPGIVGPGAAIDTDRWCVVCANVIGSCYGSTGPRSTNPRSGSPYGPSFPPVTIRDVVRSQAELLDSLGVERLAAVVGGSIGGMQALQWAVDYPERVERAIAVAAAPLSALGLALNHLQRQAIRNDPNWNGGNYDPRTPPSAGLALARSIAMCSYKSAELFAERFGRRPDRSGENPFRSFDARFDVAGYLDYQGESFTRRFDANSYIVISRAMDTFDLGFGYGGEAAALARVRARTLLVGISSDWLFPASDVRWLAERLRSAGADARYAEIASSHGHDGFLADADLLAPLVRDELLAEPPRALEREAVTVGCA